jgi:hypothetical protein
MDRVLFRGHPSLDIPHQIVWLHVESRLHKVGHGDGPILLVCDLPFRQGVSPGGLRANRDA